MTAREDVCPFVPKFLVLSMKNRSQSFDCAIAGKSVAITLRHGGGLQEPGKVYVRCDQRDCQYVDLNQPPCPLRVEMFADGSDRRVADHLAARAGAHVCYACLTETLGITHEQVRRATWRLREEIGVVIRPSRCSSCLRRRVTIGLPSGAAVRPLEDALAPDDHVASDAPERHDSTLRVLQFLVQAGSSAHCGSCLAFATDLPLAEVRRALQALEGTPELERREASCNVCGRWQVVVQGAWTTPRSARA